MICKWIRVSVAVIALIGLVWFFCPTPAGIVNIGNLTGMALCAALAAYMFFMPVVHRFVLHCWSRLFGKIVLGALGAVLGVIVITAVVISGLMIGAARRAPQTDVTVVVLGCQVNGSIASLMLRERMTAALDFLNEHPDAPCVLSGGQGADEDITEAECIYRYLVENGVDPARLYKEERSTSTRENLAFSYEIIKERGLPENIAVVTNEFHQYRAGKVADALGLSPSAVNGATAPWLFPTYYMRELYGILYEWLF